MTRGRLVLVSVTAVIAVLVVLVVVLVPGERADEAAVTGPARTSASDLLQIELAAFDGSVVRLETIAGGAPLVVNFFASWCGPCVREMPDFEAVHGRRGEEVRFVGVNLQDSPDAAAALVEQTGVTYDVVRDERGALFRAVNGFAMPTTVFVDADGDVLEVHGGELSAQGLEERIDRLLQP